MTTMPAADGVKDSLVALIESGQCRPGDRLDELTLAADLGVSRNTLREGFRALSQMGYAEHRPHRGVFVRQIDPGRGRDIYQARRLLEPGVLRELALSQPSDPQRLFAPAAAVVTRAEQAAADGDWQRVGSLNTDFHLALVEGCGNDVVLGLMRNLMVDMRMLFLSAGEATWVHARYIPENRRVVTLASRGFYAEAAVVLESYLLGASGHLVGALLKETP